MILGFLGTFKRLTCFVNKFVNQLFDNQVDSYASLAPYQD